jgi:hypothetical protein
MCMNLPGAGSSAVKRRSGILVMTHRVLTDQCYYYPSPDGHNNNNDTEAHRYDSTYLFCSHLLLLVIATFSDDSLLLLNDNDGSTLIPIQMNW